jgi:drug/metabolite transporter (DMT)-like permease
VKRDTVINWGLLFGLGIIWGFSFFFMKKGLEVYSPYQVASIRIFLAFLSGLPIIAVMGFKVPLNRLPLIFLSALLGSGIPPFFFTIAQTQISSSVAGILNSLTPLFALIAGGFLFGIKMKWMQIIGVTVGLVGSIIVVILRADGSFEFHFAFSLLVILAAVFYGINANIIKSKLLDIHPIQLAIATYCLIGPIAGIYLFSTDFVPLLKTHPKALSSLGYLVILGIVGTSFALMLFNYLARRTSALFATMVTYIIPVVAVIIGYYTGESVGIIHLFGLGLILVGVYISSIKIKEKL